MMRTKLLFLSVLTIAVTLFTGNQVNAQCVAGTQAYDVLEKTCQFYWMASGVQVDGTVNCAVANWNPNPTGTSATVNITGQCLHGVLMRTPNPLNIPVPYNVLVTCTGTNLHYPWGTAAPNNPSISNCQ